MVFVILAFLLFLLGVFGILADGATEVWMWFLAFGLALDLTIVLLTLTDWKWLRPLKQLDGWGRAAHALVFAVAAVGFWFRLKAEIGLFIALMIAAAILWALSLLLLKRSLKRSE